MTSPAAGPYVLYRDVRRGQAHRLRVVDPQPVFDRYEGFTTCGFFLRAAVAVSSNVVAVEDECRRCATIATGRQEPTDG